MVQNVIISAQTLINIINKYRQIGIKTGLLTVSLVRKTNTRIKQNLEFTPETVF